MSKTGFKLRLTYVILLCLIQLFMHLTQHLSLSTILSLVLFLITVDQCFFFFFTAKM